ncbi:IPExxxVDY family protein [Gelidibacter maritimus]|uniref:IPExxxVDY family protein n=1 Tax=Gelidibacter maritimus TaxID=2761487 RepID=A0A7W2M3H2_9FLAO|nr:IPExxxVDY family protein [Gelidibacter maritimus]MBA6151806.1 IPExxxVDY family protein [Gelidibacter maritimus]
MALHKLLVDDFYDASYSLLAVHCRLEDYRLAYLLNKYLNLNLKRQPQDLDYKYFAASYPIYEWFDEELFTTWNMVSNVCKREEDSLQSSGSLFLANEKVLKTYHLLPELKNVDFLIKITNDDRYLDEKRMVDKIQNIPQVITTYAIDVDQLRSRDNLIF